MGIVDIARVCHEANRAFCVAIGDQSQKSWDEAEPWQRESAFAGVRFRIEHPDAPPSTSHDAWSAHKVADGWTYGPVKDGGLKQHPCLVPYDDLPPEERVKDALFAAVVAALSPLIEGE